MNGHTSGAWTTLELIDGRILVLPDWADYDEGGKPVAEILTREIYEHEANARLIAAAPEMYEALVCAIEALRATEVFMCSEAPANTSSSRCTDSISGGLQETHSAFGLCGRWELEPGVDRVVNGLPHRVDRLRALGNAVVPQQAFPVFRAIFEADEQV